MDRHPGRGYPRYSRFAALITLGAGVLVLVGATNIATINSITPGVVRLVSIEINTAVAFILVGFSLLQLQARDGSRLRVAGRISALLAVVLGGLTLAQYASGWDLGIERFPFGFSIGVGLTSGEPLAIPTAFIFVLLGSATLHLYRDTSARVRRGQLLALGAMLIALFAMAGAFYGTVGRFTDVGVHTSFLILVCSLGVLWARSNQGFMATITAPGVGGIVARRLLPTAILFPFVLEFLRLKGEDAGWYGPQLGRALSTISTIALLAGLVWINARLLNRGESAVFASMADGAISVDPSGRIVTVNRAMEKLSGVPLVMARGRHYSDAYRFFDRNGERVPAEEMVIERSIEQKEVLSGRGYGIALEAIDGQRVPVSVSAAPILGVEDELVGAVVVVRDVSYEEEVDQLKSQLISTVSHELRTPLTMIQGFSELLMARHLDDDDTREAVEQIHTSSERLGRLVNDLLSVARIESGTLVPDFALLELPDLVHEVVKSFGAGKRTIEVDIEEDLPRVVADHDKVIQILTNLVSNAIKYSSADSKVDIKARNLGTDVEVVVEDHGIGMSAADLDRLFAKFFRSDRTEVVDIGGTGLGLYIAKSLVEVQGGTMSVKSELNKGSSFSFTLAAAGGELEGGRSDEKETAHSG